MKTRTSVLLNDPQWAFLELAKHSSDVVIIADAHRVIIFANTSACLKTGYKLKELLGQKIPSLYREDDRSKLTSAIYKDLTENGRWEGEVDVQRKDGSTFTTETVIIALHDENGNPAGTIGIGHDLSERRLLEQRSMESESRLQSIIESMEDAVCVSDTGGRILMCNMAHARMLGYAREEIVGAKMPYPWLDPLDMNTMKDAFKLLAKKGVVRNYTVSWRRRDATRLAASLALAFLRDTSKQIIGSVITVRDVSDVQHVEELRRTNDRIQRLLADVKHKAERLHALEETNRLVLHNADVASIFKSITSSIKKLVAHDLAGVYVYEPREAAFMPHTLSKQSAFSRKLAKFPLPLGEGMIGEAATSGKMVWVNNAHQDPRSRYPVGMKPACEHVIAVPLRGKETMFGILAVARHGAPEFIEEEAMVVKSFADAASVALENARLSHELTREQQSISEFLFRNAKKVKTKSATRCR